MDDKGRFMERYLLAVRAVQGGVVLEMLGGSKATSGKSLRVGVNVAMVEHGALARLLVDKGVITELEYAEAIAVGMEAEQAKYEKILGMQLG